MYEEKDASYFALLRPEMLKYVPTTSKRILEFGCSNGDFGAQIKSLIPCVYDGVEPFEESAKVAKTRLDNVTVTTVEDFINQPSFGELKYDTLIFNDVLEHLLDPYTVLDKLRAVLSPGGVVVASIPNILNFAALRQLIITKDFAYQEHGIFDKTHFRFFSKKSIIRMFEEAGYSIEKIDGINRNTGGVLFHTLNFLTLKHIDEFKFKQFAVVAKVR